MARYETLTPEQMTPEQRKVVDNVTAGPRGSATRGPFMAWLPSPKFADLAQARQRHVALVGGCGIRQWPVCRGGRPRDDSDVR